MHRTTRKLLPKARGVAGFGAVVNVDVRGFTSFAKLAESSEAAMFLRCAYTRLLDRYFDECDFFKLTGDGMVIVYSYDQDSLKVILPSIIEKCLSVVKEFSTICADDPMINFKVPDRVGIGMARGAVTSLVSGRTVLDYSGWPLNLASRLMDLARPTGVVFDESLGFELLPGRLAKRFKPDSVYIRGLAEREPLAVYYSSDYTTMAESSKQPLDRMRWETDSIQLPLKLIRERGPSWIHRLSKTPTSPKNVQVEVVHPGVGRGGRKMDFFTYVSLPPHHYEYETDPKGPIVRIDYYYIAEMLEDKGVKSNWTVKIDVQYTT
jgi:class 3 adenylate cyclase